MSLANMFLLRTWAGKVRAGEHSHGPKYARKILIAGINPLGCNLTYKEVPKLTEM
jgi:hypothetical protein